MAFYILHTELGDRPVCDFTDLSELSARAAMEALVPHGFNGSEYIAAQNFALKHNVFFEQDGTPHLCKDNADWKVVRFINSEHDWERRELYTFHDLPEDALEQAVICMQEDALFSDDELNACDPEEVPYETARFTANDCGVMFTHEGYIHSGGEARATTSMPDTFEDLQAAVLLYADEVRYINSDPLHHMNLMGQKEWKLGSEIVTMADLNAKIGKNDEAVPFYGTNSVFFLFPADDR